MNNIVVKSALLLLAILLVVIGGIYLNEARKEVYYLCGNFSEGTRKVDVIRQLKTGTFLHYTDHITAMGSQLYVDSNISLQLATCTITFDQQRQVLSAVFKGSTFAL